MIRTLDQTLTYEVDQIRIVLPDEVDDLKVEEGKDPVYSGNLYSLWNQYPRRAGEGPQSCQPGGGRGCPCHSGCHAGG